MIYFESLSDILSIVITASVALGGAIWGYRIYRQRRRGLPKANLSQEVQVIKLTDNRICIHTSARIKNVGDVMISIRSATNRVLQILPLDDSIQEGLKGDGKLYDDRGKEIKWPGYGKTIEWERGKFEIEPGGPDTVHFDLIIPANLEKIQVYTYFQNIVKRERNKRERNIGWHIQQFYEVSKLLSGGK